MSGKSKVYSREIIARALNLSEKRVKQLTDDGIIMQSTPGNYELYPTMQRYIAYLQSLTADDDKTSDYNVEKARLTRAKREAAEQALQLTRNELHRAADVEFIMTNMLIAFKAKLETLPHKILPNIISVPPGRDKADYLAEILKTAVDGALDELTDYSPEMFNVGELLAKFDGTEEGTEE